MNLFYLAIKYLVMRKMLYTLLKEVLKEKMFGK
jgi:hypothetical protein